MSTENIWHERLKKALEAIARWTPPEEVGDWRKTREVRPSITRGASDNELAKVEKTLRCKLPPDYRAFLKISNGVRWFQETFDLLSTSQLMGSRTRNEAHELFRKWENAPLPKGILIGFNPINADILMFAETPRGDKEVAVLSKRPPFKTFASFGAFLEARAKEVSRGHKDDSTTIPQAVWDAIKADYSQPATVLEFEERGKPAFKDTRLAGAPAWPKSSPWPACRACKSPMSFRAQLVARQFPRLKASINAEALFIFVCNNDDCQPSLSNADQVVDLRFEKLADVVKAAPPPQPSTDRPEGYKLRSKDVSDFKGSLFLTQDDLAPVANVHKVELRLLAKKVNDAIDAESKDFPWKPHEGLKLGGFPAWIQDPQKAACKRCHKTMPLYIQMSYAVDNRQFYVFRCPCSPSVFVTRWEMD